VNKILTQDLHNVKCTCKQNANVTLTSKSAEFKWTFSVRALDCSEKSLQCVSLLSESGVESNFIISKVQEKIIHTENTEKLKTYYPEPSAATEWMNANENQSSAEYKIEITFKASVYGTFKQSVIFSFGSEPYLRKDVSVDVKPALDDEESKLEELQDILVAQGERWSGANCQIKDFSPVPLQVVPPEDQFLYQNYPMPQPASFRPSRAVIEHSLTKLNYKQRMHDLLYIEEMAQFEQISHFNVKVTLKIINKYLLCPTSTNSSTAKYARPGEMFGSMSLRGSLSEDTTAGRLILTNCTSLLLKAEGGSNKKNANVAYVTGIEDSGKANLYLRLSSNLVQDYKLKDEDSFKVEVQFQLNRLPLCEMHLAIDKLHDLSLVYPDISRPVKIPWTPLKYWSSNDDISSRLNA